MSISSAGTILYYSTTDIAHDAGGWTAIGCILDANRNNQQLGIDVQDGCLSEAISTPAVAKHKTPNGFDPGQLQLNLEFVVADYSQLLTWCKNATKLWFKFVDPNVRDSAGALTLTSCAREKLYGWVTNVGKAHPAGGGRMTADVTIEADSAAYTATP
jgi:hypothetical protein